MTEYTPTSEDVLAAVALGVEQGNPVIDTIVAARAGVVDGLDELHPLVLVDALRMLAILGEWPTITTLYQALEDHPAGVVHFEAGIAAQMQGDREGAKDRYRLAATGREPQPMAWNSLAAALCEEGELDDAWIAVQAGMEAMPDDAITVRTATTIAILRGDEASAKALGFPGDVAAERAEALSRGPSSSFGGHAQIAMDAAVAIMRLPAMIGDIQVEAARLLMTRAVQLDPLDERARRGLEALQGG
jgi:hypothetical protein